jgi:FADH2 O2-dependent halogenase
MIRERAEIAILGAGFAGSLMALILRQIGRQTVLLERGAHPRFAIGESSTPQADLILEGLCATYNLPRLFPLTRFGRWQRTYPQLPCGLKRGFTFMQHRPGEVFRPTPDHANELLVAASSADEISDTHWFRAGFDHFLVQEVQAAGIPYFDRTDITGVDQDRSWQLRGQRNGEPVEIDAEFVIDATGPTGLLARTLGISTEPVGLHTHSWSVLSHFTGVALWEEMLSEAGARTADHPFHCDDAALHHVLADGWIYVLRFNNGITSAGVLFDGERHPPDLSVSPEAEWQRVLEQYPSIGRQFDGARAIEPWVRTGRLQRRASRAAGPNWVMLPHAAYFLDALFSGGIAHTLLGIERLARILERSKDNSERVASLLCYEQSLFREVEFLDWLIHGSYCAFARFDFMAAYTMYYFAGAVQSEMRRRNGTYRPDDEFLYSHDLAFRAAVRASHDYLADLRNDLAPAAQLAEAFQQRVARDIAAINLGGFCDPEKKNMYPFV